MKRLKVLVGCEFSGVIRNAFAERGHYAVSCDVLPSETPGLHIQGDVQSVLDWEWDLGIFSPPCTFLTLAGARWFGDPKYPNRYKDREDAITFFQALQNAPIPRICIENSQPLGYVTDRVGPYTQKVQPWMFGEGETKGACLWLKNLPKLVPTDIVPGRLARVHMESPGPDRGKRRSVTYKGLANAMADAWGNLD